MNKTLPLLLILFLIKTPTHCKARNFLTNKTVTKITPSLEKATEQLIDLCITIAQSTHTPDSRILEKLIKRNIVHKKPHHISMKTLIKIVRYAGVTLKICEIQEDLPQNRIRQMSDLLATYWAAVWEQWHYKYVYPVNLDLLVRTMETNNAK